jgi:poly(A) polymerase
MKIDKLLLDIELVARDNKLSRPLLVGGTPRDRVLGEIGTKSEIQDLDITTGDSTAHKLAFLLGEKYKNNTYREYDDGHTSLEIAGLHIDFSSNFKAPGIEVELQKMGVKDITPMKLEIFSRDFTINTLLETLDFTTLYDLTGEGMDDLRAGIIRCPIDPNITIGVDPRRILRAIKFSIKYGFKIEDKLKNAILEHRKKIQTLPKKFVQDKIQEIVLLNAERGIDMLINFKLLPLVPLSKTVSDTLIQQRKLVRAL